MLRLTDNGLFPEGVYPCTLDEVQEAFGRFQGSDRRPRLFQKLRDYAEAVGKASFAATLMIDGSFVMSQVDAPEDIDIVLILPADWDLAGELRPFEYNLVAKQRVRITYGFDLFVVRSGSEEETIWTEFFQQISPKWTNAFQLPQGLKKGIVTLKP